MWEINSCWLHGHHNAKGVHVENAMVPYGGMTSNIHLPYTYQNLWRHGGHLVKQVLQACEWCAYSQCNCFVVVLTIVVRLL